MRENRPFVHFFFLSNDIYMLDVNTNVISKVNRNIYEYINSSEHMGNIEESDLQLITNMRNQGLLKPSNIKKIEHPMTEYIEDIVNNNMKKITLQVTQNCNFRCEYCVYSGSYHNRIHNNKRMDWETAKAALDFLFMHSKNSSEIAVSFYGGEPLLEIELIERCVNYTKDKFRGKKINFGLTTNASLLNDDIIRYMSEENFFLTISIDGPKEVHDKNRKYADSKRGTFNTVMLNVQRIKDISPSFVENLSLNAVLDDENDFKKINDFFKNNLTVKDIAVSTTYINQTNRKIELKNYNERNYIEICREKFRAMMCLLKRLPKECVSKIIRREVMDIGRVIHERTIAEEVIGVKAHPGGPCVPGAHKPFVSAYGKLYPCERVNETCDEMCIGNIYDGFNVESIKRLLVARH